MNENNETQVVETNEGQTEKTTYTQEEVDALLQRETDRRVTQALKKQEQKTEARLKEAQKLAEKEKALALAENKTEASKILSEKGLSLQLVDFVVAEDAETMKANIDLLDTAFKQSVKAEVEKRLAGNAPKKNLPLDRTITKEEFRKMSYSDIVALKNSNPELYRSLAD